MRGLKQQLLSCLLLAKSGLALPLATETNETSNSFAGVNSYFLHAFQESNRTDVLDAIHDAGLKVLRIFISQTDADNKGTGSVYMPDIEPVTVGVYNDTQLLAIDQLMVEAHQRDIKLTIAFHDRYQLGCWGNDSYVYKFNLPAINCAFTPASKNNVTSFYTDAAPITDFEHRMAYVLNHRNELIPGAPAWKDLSDYIFSFNLENEGEGHLNNNTAPVPNWWCDRAKFARGIMQSSRVLISTGGGNEFSNSDIPENWACDSLDIVDMHSYSNISVYETKAPVALSHALNAKKLMMFEEFGATGVNKSANIAQYIALFNRMRVPWSPWEISKPGKGASDFEFWTDEPTYDVVKQGAEAAEGLVSAQPWQGESENNEWRLW